MPDEPRRIVIEKSSTVRRRYQRSNKRFKFTAEQLKRIERDEARERRAKELREKEKRRIANKKKKAEQEAKDREERRRQGLPDPNVKVPSSQPLLSRFLGLTSRPLSAEGSVTEESLAGDTTFEILPPDAKAESKKTEISFFENKRDIDIESVGGDTEVGSDAIDDLEEELEREVSSLEDAGVPETGNAASHDYHELPCPAKDDDEFSDCSVFYDEDIIKEADTITATQFVEQSTNPLISGHNTLSQTPLDSASKSLARSMVSIGDSFRDDTANFLEEVFARGSGDSFGELVRLDSTAQ